MSIMKMFHKIGLKGESPFLRELEQLDNSFLDSPCRIHVGRVGVKVLGARMKIGKIPCD